MNTGITHKRVGSQRERHAIRPIRLILVDDHQMVREGLGLMLKEDAELTVRGEAGEGNHALDLAAKVHPDVALVDISMPGMDGIELCRRLLNQDPAIGVIMLTTFMDRHLLDECIKAGARGYILKDVEHTRLREIIKIVARGESVIDSKILSQLTFKSPNDVSPAHNLSMRQITILTLISQGFSNKEIAMKLVNCNV